MKLDMKVNKEMIEIVKSLRKAGCFFMLLLDGSPFADLEEISKPILADNGIHLIPFDAGMNLEEVKKRASEDDLGLLLVPDCMDNTIDELIGAKTSFVVIVNKMKVHEPVPFFDRECLKITVKMTFCNVGSQIEAMKSAFGDNAKSVLDSSITHGVWEDTVYTQID